MDEFVHLHVHTDRSILDGHSTIPELAAECARLGQPALAKTDHGSLAGARLHWETCNEYGIKPIIGCEFYVAPGPRTTKEPVFWGEPGQRSDDVGGSGAYTHLTVLATTAEGVRNLFRLHATSYADGFYRKPRIDLDSLAEHSRGLLVTTGCAGGALATRIRLGQHDEAREMAGTLRDIFNENIFIEIMEHDNPVDKIINPHLIRLSREMSIPLVATNDSHYTIEKSSLSHDALLCIQTRQQIDGVRSFRFEGSGYFLRNRAQMEALFREIPDAVRNTLRIAERVEDCSAAFSGTSKFPRYSQPDFATNDEYLRDRVGEFISGRVWSDRDATQRRADYELDTISALGFPDYFLTLKDMTDEARRRRIRVGPGRGSVGGSFVAYGLGITDLDPLVHGLLFERFLNPERVSNPDIDVDIQDDRRDELIEWAVEKYGREYFAQIGTESVIKAKSAIKDAARVLGAPYITGEQLTYRLPRAKFGREPALSEGDWSGLTESEQEIIHLASSLEGRVRSQSVHAAGIVISPEPLRDILPLYLPGGKHPSWVTAYGMDDVEALGLVKYDWLGLKNLTVIENAVEHIKKLNIPWEIPVLSTDPKDLTDDQTYELLRTGNTLGVFQLDSPGMQQLLRSLGPTEFGDISAVLALYRPGPMAANAHTGYAKRKNGKERISYPHSELERDLRTVLGPTYGYVVYQEQVLEILRICCGYTYATAEGIFNAMRKKDQKKMLAAKPDFTKRMLEKGYSQQCVTALWDVLVPFSDYSFNKSHTTGYGVVAYWTGYLKTHFPNEYMSAVLSAQTKPEKLIEYLDEVERMGVPVLPPDINTSGVQWTPTADGIRYGLKSIKGFGDTGFTALMKERPYASLDDFFKRANRYLLSKKNLKILVQSGALDSLCASREALFLHHESLAERALSDRKLMKDGAIPLTDTTYTVDDAPGDYNLRQRWEKELLGTVLSLPVLTISVNRWLDEQEFYYIRRVVEQYPGRQELQMTVGYATIVVGRVNMTDKLKTQLKSIGGITIK